MNEFNKIIEQELAQGINLSIINLVDQLVRYACKVNASDIPIDQLRKPFESVFRIDGVLESSYSAAQEYLFRNNFKELKFFLSFAQTNIKQLKTEDFVTLFLRRTNLWICVFIIVPTYHGENAVMRLLSDKMKISV